MPLISESISIEKESLYKPSISSKDLCSLITFLAISLTSLERLFSPNINDDNEPQFAPNVVIPVVFWTTLFFSSLSKIITWS